MCPLYDLFHTNAHNKSTVHSLDESYSREGEQSNTSPQILSSIGEIVLFCGVVLKRFPIQRKPRAKIQLDTQESAFHTQKSANTCMFIDVYVWFFIFSSRCLNSGENAELIFT